MLDVVGVKFDSLDDGGMLEVANLLLKPEMGFMGLTMESLIVGILY